MATIIRSGGNTLPDDEGNAVLIGENRADRQIEGGDRSAWTAADNMAGVSSVGDTQSSGANEHYGFHEALPNPDDSEIYDFDTFIATTLDAVEGFYLTLNDDTF